MALFPKSDSVTADENEKSSSTITSAISLKSANQPHVVPASDEKSILQTPVEEEEEEVYPEGGRGWWVVAGCFIQAGATMGLPLAWGVFQDYYHEHMFPDTSEAILGFLGSVNGIALPTAAFVFGKLEDRYGYRPFVILGSVLSVLSWFTAAWCTKLWQLFLTQGILQGLSNGILFPTFSAYPAQWFKKKRALAIGITIAGSSIGGGTSAIIFRVLLNRFGLRHGLLIYSAINAASLLVGFILVKERPDMKASTIAKRRGKITWIDTTLFSSKIFWSMALCTGITVFGYTTPYVFAEVYTIDKNPNISSFLSTIPILVLNYAAAIGRTIVGHGADRLGPVNIFMISILLSALSQLFIWNFAQSYAAILVFSVVYGFWGGIVISLMSPVGAALFGADKMASLSGILMLSNMPGVTAGPTLGGVVLGSGSSKRWHGVATYSGGLQLLGLLIFCYARFKTNPKLFVKI